MTRSGICAICGEAPATTRDHVPPKACFTVPLPPNLITVPACAGCNNGASGLDEEFRVYLALSVGRFGGEAQRLWKVHGLDSLKNNARLRREIRRTFAPAAVFAQSGVIDSGFFSFLIPREMFAKVIERIARGLYFNHYGQVLGRGAKCCVEKLDGVPNDLDLSGFHYNQIGNGAFAYRYGRVAESPLTSLWIFEFYQAYWATVHTYPAADQSPTP